MREVMMNYNTYFVVAKGVSLDTGRKMRLEMRVIEEDEESAKDLAMIHAEYEMSSPVITSVVLGHDFPGVKVMSRKDI